LPWSIDKLENKTKTGVFNQHNSKDLYSGRGCTFLPYVSIYFEDEETGLT
jgi:hypothetical protein